MGLSGFVKKLKAEVNITDLISSYIPIQKSGKNYKARCPFHEERTASFYIYESTQSYHCFGCGKNGDIIKFVQDYENVDFKEAVEKIATMYDIQIPSADYAADKKYTDYTNDMRFIESVFRDNLVKGTSAWQYLQDQRGLNPEKLKELGAGFALYQDVQKLSAELDKKRLKELGIITESGSNLFANRLILPIHDVFGRTVAFSGRKLNSETSSPKYINSPQTEFFNKSRILYLLDKAKSEIKDVDFVIIVEGYFDALRLYMNGIRNVVAVMGTALTKEHLKELGKYTNKLVFSFDNDKAGINAIGKSYVQLSDRFNALVLNLNPVKDPDEYVGKYGIEGFQQILLKAVSIEEYLLGELKSRYNLERETGRDALIKKSRGILARTRRAGNISRFDKLISMLSEWTGLEKNLLLESWNVDKKSPKPVSNVSLRKEAGKVATMPNRRVVQIRSIVPEEELMILYLFHPTTRKKIESLFHEYSSVMHGSYHLFFNDVREKFNPDDAADYLKNYFEEEQIDYFVRQLERYERPETLPDIIADCETKLNIRKSKQDLMELDEAIQKATGNEVKALIEKRYELSKVIHTLNKSLKGGH
ncbi:MAG TPA: DNA primase [Thermotogota bacterium]|nr:DNA primase [Thermotogota bacterium]HPJ88071.1 DNA primase [Thermotogota bacterium]HPR96256.1 DNA primase [Thermotogota bacterium]